MHSPLGDGNILHQEFSLLWCRVPSGDHSYNSKYGCCCCLVTELCPTLCNTTKCSTPGFPVLHDLLEFAQIKNVTFDYFPSMLMLKFSSSQTFHLRMENVVLSLLSY